MDITLESVVYLYLQGCNLMDMRIHKGTVPALIDIYSHSQISNMVCRKASPMN